MEKSAHQIRVRFAPSPTGQLHIGGARTALYNWLFARVTGGKFVLRIEDTDPIRSTKENVDTILRSLRWLGLDWDEGPEVEGEYGPYFQTQRSASYRDVLAQLQEIGAVYPCFCTKEVLEAKRHQAEQSGLGYNGYDGHCYGLSTDEVNSRMSSGEPFVWRLHVPDFQDPVTFTDLVYGDMSFSADVLDDLILVRSDGTPTYNFAVVCDDISMDITHVIRGDDHLSNTPRQILIYKALSIEPPVFAHLSMILGPDGKKLSKRHGATSVEEYRDRGYLPDALVNYLSLLGWSLDGESTIISKKTLCSEFSFERVSKKHAIFDEKKLAWMNGVYIRNMPFDDWLDFAAPWIALTQRLQADVGSGATIIDAGSASLSNTSFQSLRDELLEDENFQNFVSTIKEDSFFYRKVYDLIIERLQRFDEIPHKLAYLYWGESVLLDEPSVRKVLLKEEARAHEALLACRDILGDELRPWEAESLQSSCLALCDSLSMKPKFLFQPLRVAVCGNMVSLPLFESIELMKREDVLSRIDSTIHTVFS